MQAKVDRTDGKLVEQDIAARRQEALVGLEFAKHVDRIQAALDSTKSNLSLDQWCRHTCGCDIGTMRRRKRLYRHWREYEVKRRELGACGQTGLLFALSLVRDDPPATGMNRQGSPVRRDPGTGLTKFSLSRCQLITGDALTELRKIPAKSVNTIVTSPPYWPAKRAYGGTGIGFEAQLPDYIAKIVAVLRAARMALRDDGVLWLCVDDSYQDGNLLFIPSQLGMAMQHDGWICRSEVIWSKKGGGRPDPVKNRPIKEHEKVLMFSKQRNGYHYDADPIRSPLSRPHSTPGKRKPGIYRRDFDRTERVWANPMGRPAGSVWEIAPASYRGSHAATMPPELVRRCLAVSCPDNSVVLDCFGGAGTTALVALTLGHRAISIEINPLYTAEARRRIATEIGSRGEPQLLAAD
jgi:site-specific DNA-methyltransferase (adenine-specific)